MVYPEISTRELIAKLDSEDFYKKYGNPVRCKIFDTDKILLSFDLYERLFGKVDLEKENTIEIDDFIRALEFEEQEKQNMMERGTENDD